MRKNIGKMLSITEHMVNDNNNKNIVKNFHIKMWILEIQNHLNKTRNGSTYTRTK